MTLVTGGRRVSGWQHIAPLLLLGLSLVMPAPRLSAEEAPEQPLFTFVQISDTHVIAGKSVDSVRRAVRDINLLEPAPKFVIGTGDLIDGTLPEESTRLLQQTFSQLECPFLPVFGNHDNREWFKKLLGESNYALDLPPYHLIVLDNIEMGSAQARDTYGARFSDGTIAWLKEHLQGVDPKTPLLLFAHASVYRENAYSKALPGDVHHYLPVLELLKPYRVVAWFTGHAHYNCVIRKENTDYITTGCLSDHRQNANAPLGYRLVKVYPDRVETTYRAITEFRAPVVVAQDGSGDFNGADDRPIRQAVEKAAKEGGVVLIQPGEYLIRSQIRLPSNLTLAGTPKTLLRLPSPVLTTAAAAKGDQALSVTDAAAFTPETRVQICPPGEAKSFPEQTTENVRLPVGGVQPGKVLLSEPLPFAIPAGSRVGYSDSMLFIGGSDKNITIRNLVLDGGLTEGIAMPAHTDRCAILAHGIWSYEKGPTAPPIENVRVIGCHLRNCYGRAVALYSVARARVEGCLIENIADEAVDLDHFCTHCEVVGNEIRNGATGVTINDASDCTVTGNRISRCGVGVTIWWWHMCPMKEIDIRNRIVGNFITAPKGAGVSIGKRCFWNEVVDNFVEGGIKVEEPANVVRGNFLR